MKTELTDVSSVHKEIKIEIEAAEIAPVYQKVVKQYARMATIPGFRKGYAPVDVIKTRYRDEIKNDTLRELLPERVTQAIAEHSLSPLSEPQLHLDDAETVNVTGANDIALHVHVEVMPVLEDPDYKNLSGVRRVRPVADEEIERVIEGQRKEQESFVPIEDRKAETGDTVSVDIRGTFVDDPQADPIVVEDLNIELGAAGVQPEFTENLLGVEPEDERTFTVEYSADFSSPAMAGKKIEYTATVKSLGKVELPEVTDEWAASLDEGFESAADMRGKIRQDLETMAKADADARVREELMNQLIDRNAIEVPPTLTQHQAQALTQQFAQNMEQQGMDMRQADDKLWQMLFQRMLPQAEREVRGAFLLDKIGMMENIEATEEDLNEEFESIARYSGRTAEEIKQILTAQENGEANIKERIRNRKTIEILAQNAEITDGEWQEENQIAAQPEATAETETPEDAPEKSDEQQNESETATA